MFVLGLDFGLDKLASTLSIGLGLASVLLIRPRKCAVNCKIILVYAFRVCIIASLSVKFSTFTYMNHLCSQTDVMWTGTLVRE